MRETNYYVSLLVNESLEVAVARVKRDAISDIEDIVANYDEQDLYELLEGTDYVDGIHPMDEFDDVFEGYSAREALEELTDIDLSDDWFNEYSKESSRDLVDALGASAHDIAKDIYNEDLEIDDDDCFDVYEEAQEIIDELEIRAKKINLAKALLENAVMNDNVDEAINVLWNMNA